MSPRMRRAYATALLLVLAVPGCPKPSALETASADLPEGEKPVSPSEVRAHVMRENAKRRGEQRAEPGANQVQPTRGPDAGTGPTASATTPGPAPTEHVASGPAGGGPWRGSFVAYDGSFVRIEARVDFGEDQSPSADARRVLDEVATLLRERPEIKALEVQAHVHGKFKGDAVKVTQARADAVRRYLVGKGIGGERLSAIGHGADMPIDTNRTEEGRQANTRVELIVKALGG